jgi:hypothetical protein
MPQAIKANECIIHRQHVCYDYVLSTLACTIYINEGMKSWNPTSKLKKRTSQASIGFIAFVIGFSSCVSSIRHMCLVQGTDADRGLVGVQCYQ